MYSDAPPMMGEGRDEAENAGAAPEQAPSETPPAGDSPAEAVAAETPEKRDDATAT